MNLAKDMMVKYLKVAYHGVTATRGGDFLNDADTLDHIDKVADLLTGNSPKWGLIFFGDTGNGKTTLMLTLQKVVNWLAETPAIPGNVGLRIVNAKDIHKAGDNKKRFQLLCNDDLLGIDDLGAEPTEEMEFGNVTTPVIDLLEYRYSRQLFTVCTTNLAPSGLRDKYGNRIADRCREMFVKIVFKNQSFRK